MTVRGFKTTVSPHFTRQGMRPCISSHKWFATRRRRLCWWKNMPGVQEGMSLELPRMTDAGLLREKIQKQLDWTTPRLLRRPKASSAIDTINEVLFLWLMA